VRQYDLFNFVWLAIPNKMEWFSLISFKQVALRLTLHQCRLAINQKHSIYSGIPFSSETIQGIDSLMVEDDERSEKV
jgi:hypothetical protein